MKRSTLSFETRVNFCISPLAKKLLATVIQKKSNLALSADVTSSKELLAIANELGPYICLLKTHIDILEDFNQSLIEELVALANKHQFLLFEDRKFADIGHTVKHQYEGGTYHIADWAHLVTAHSLPGPGILKGLAEVAQTKESGVLLLAEMSSAGHLMDDHYIKETVAMADAFPNLVVGFIAQHALSEDPKWIYLTPGIQLDAKNDHLGQQYTNPEHAIGEKGTDIIIVGRGITHAQNRVDAAKKYRQRGWDSYLKRTHS